MTQNGITIENLPKAVLAEAKELLRGDDDRVEVIRWNRRIRAVGHIFPYEHSMDERLLLTIRREDVFTEEEIICNHINRRHEYPANYRGKRDVAMLALMDADMDYDPATQTLYEPFGSMEDGDFVYRGERRAFKG